MSLWPASDEITLTHAGCSVRLRPSLRAASIYAQQPGFEALFRRLDDFHLGTVADLIRMTATDRREADAFLKTFDGVAAITMIAAVQSPAIALARSFIPQPVQPLEKQKATERAIAWPEVYRNLYHTATGWLGWTARQTWQATPNEINHAFHGHLAMLKATGVLMADKEEQQSDDVYSSERLKQIDELGYDPAFDPAALRAFKAKVARGVA